MRNKDWRPALVKYLRNVAREEYREGHNDCALFAAGAVAAMTGVDHAAPYRGRYKTTRGGLRVLRRDGFADHVDLAAKHLREIPPAAARPGDLAAVPGAGGVLALGVVQGEMVYVLTPRRVGVVPRSEIKRAFEV